MRGVVNFFSTKGWGFLGGEDGNDYFVHHSSIASDVKFKMLMKDDEVEFDIVPSDKKRPLAVNVRVTRAYKNEVKDEATNPYILG